MRLLALVPRGPMLDLWQDAHEVTAPKLGIRISMSRYPGMHPSRRHAPLHAGATQSPSTCMTLGKDTAHAWPAACRVDLVQLPKTWGPGSYAVAGVTISDGGAPVLPWSSSSGELYLVPLRSEGDW